MDLNRQFEYSGHLDRYQTDKDQPLPRRQCYRDASAYRGSYRSAKESAALDATILAYIADDGVTTIKRIHGRCVDGGLPIKDSHSGYKMVLTRVRHLLRSGLTSRNEVVDPTRSH